MRFLNPNFSGGANRLQFSVSPGKGFCHFKKIAHFHVILNQHCVLHFKGLSMSSLKAGGCSICAGMEGESENSLNWGWSGSFTVRVIYLFFSSVIQLFFKFQKAQE